MTSVALAARPAPSGRLWGVVRLQFVNRQTFVWIPLMVLGGSWVITFAIFAILAGAEITTSGAPGDGSVTVIGGAQAPMWYFLAAGAQALAYTFPFSQAVTVTRREFFVGSLLAAALSAAGMALVFVALGLIEQATDGYGFGAVFAYNPWFWSAGAVAAWFAYLVTTLLAFIVGFWFATIYKQWGAGWLTATIIAAALAILGVVGFLTWRDLWAGMGAWIGQIGVVGLSFWGLVLGAVLAAGSFLTLRRMPA
ncbi:hypothetical protein [Microbacterium sp.]|uniref:hypothetical protein n=1 Tax=Microbacterium sp. TaxID=51671 RepID=UPI003A844E8E